MRMQKNRTIAVGRPKVADFQKAARFGANIASDRSEAEAYKRCKGDPMKLTIRTRHVVLTSEMSAEIRQRLERSFDRVQPWIHGIDVMIADINGPKGGADKQCRLRIRGRSLPSIVIEHVGVDTLATVAVVAERAEQAVLRRMARRRAFVQALAF